MLLKYCSKSWRHLYAFQIEFFPVENFERKKEVKLLQDLNPASVICICYDFFIIY